MIYKKKAQLAVETLLIYGVAILIVMLAITALIGFGILDLGGLLPDQCQISDALTCENYAVSTTGVQLELQNTLGKNIQNFTVNIEGEGDNKGLWGCTPKEYNTTLVNGVRSNPVLINCDIQVPAGKKIQGVITITLYPLNSQIARTVTGKIRATVSG